MPKIQIPKKLRTEDFDSDYSTLIDKVGYAYNDFADSVYQVLSGGIDITNLNRQIVQLDVNIDSTGKIINSPQIKLTMTVKPSGTNVIRAQNILNPTIYPVSQPFISFSLNENILTIQNVSGLQPGSRYRLTFEIM